MIGPVIELGAAELLEVAGAAGALQELAALQVPPELATVRLVWWQDGARWCRTAPRLVRALVDLGWVPRVARMEGAAEVAADDSATPAAALAALAEALVRCVDRAAEMAARYTTAEFVHEDRALLLCAARARVARSLATLAFVRAAAVLEGRIEREGADPWAAQMRDSLLAEARLFHFADPWTLRRVAAGYAGIARDRAFWQRIEADAPDAESEAAE